MFPGKTLFVSILSVKYIKIALANIVDQRFLGGIEI